jgi:hypothetical protein
MLHHIPCKRRLAALAAFAALGVLPALASASDYTYIEGGFLFRHDYTTDGGGARVAGSFGIPLSPLAIIAEYDGSDGLSQADAGVIFHVPVAPVVDVFGGGTIEHADHGGDSDTGVGARLGVRLDAAPGLELAPEFRFVHLYHRDESSLRLSALYAIAPHLDLQGAIQGGDEQRYEVGVRYSFGLIPL